MSSAGDVRRVVASVAVSNLGSAAYNVGIAVYAYTHTHSATWVAIATVGRYVPALALSWQAGRFADRFARRSLAVVCNLASAITMVVLTLGALLHWPLLGLVLIAAVSSTVSRVQQSAVLALAADVVVESQLAKATLLMNTAQAVAAAAGSALAAALLLGLQAPVLFFFNSLSFAFSATLLSGVTPAKSRAVRRWRRTGGPGCARWGGRRLWPLLLSRVLVAYGYGTDLVLLTLVADRELGSGIGGYGWLLAATGAGGLVAALLLRALHARQRSAVMATGGLLLYTLPLALFVFRTDLAAGMAVQVVRGVGIVVAASTVMAAIQHSVPSELSGRVFGSVQSLVLAGTCVGAVATPLLVHLAGLDGALVIGATVPAVVQLAAVPGLARFDRADVALLVALDPRVVVLRELDLFHDASRATLYELADGVSESSAGPGEVIIAQGEPAGAFYVMVSGEAVVTVATPEGPALLRRLAAPAYFGEIGLVRGVPRTATVTATSPSVVWRIPAEVFLSALSQAGVSSALGETVRLRFETGPKAVGD